MYCTWYCNVPGTVLYLVLYCTWYCTVPGTVLYLVLYCTWYCTVPGTVLYCTVLCRKKLKIQPFFPPEKDRQKTQNMQKQQHDDNKKDKEEETPRRSLFVVLHNSVHSSLLQIITRHFEFVCNPILCN